MMRVPTNFARRRKIQPGLTFSDKDHEVKPIVQRLGNPTMSPGDGAEMNAAMIRRHGAVMARISRPADKLKWISRSEVFIGIMATVNTSGRFAAELSNPARV